jgi:hypothetical protein
MPSIPQAPLLRLAAALLLAVALPSCGSGTPTPTGVASAKITLTVAPNPIPTVATSGSTFVVRWTSTIKETAGQGATVELVEARLYDDATGIVIAATAFDEKDLIVFVGSKRVEANSKLDIPQELSYTATAKRATLLTVRVRVKDDKGNTLEQSLLVKVT